MRLTNVFAKYKWIIIVVSAIAIVLYMTREHLTNNPPRRSVIPKTPPRVPRSVAGRSALAPAAVVPTAVVPTATGSPVSAPTGPLPTSAGPTAQESNNGAAKQKKHNDDSNDALAAYKAANPESSKSDWANFVRTWEAQHPLV
jgi:hypothetical protein